MLWWCVVLFLFMLGKSAYGYVYYNYEYTSIVYENGLIILCYLHFYWRLNYHYCICFYVCMYACNILNYAFMHYVYICIDCDAYNVHYWCFDVCVHASVLMYIIQICIIYVCLCFLYCILLFTSIWSMCCCVWIVFLYICRSYCCCDYTYMCVVGVLILCVCYYCYWLFV